MDISIIAAIARNGAIGRNQGLPWEHLMEDMMHFRKSTLGKTCIVGRRTLELIGGSLPGRKLVCVSSCMELVPRGATWAPNPQTALSYAIMQAIEDGQDEVMVIGGKTIYEQLLPMATKFYLTTVKEDCEGDVFWSPTFSDWKVVDEAHHERCTIATLSRIPNYGEHRIRIPLETVSEMSY